ncbi:hypothetical protein CHS0354_042325 [Potamilus streckersoni]|uniref:Uncharacterized protein n=1 Tax=Potamilus streckersoni TaxID=2493646 RepID=A0AAE0W2K7_9BIVA|nr:hypothetical protein CHS0354_042325 [Potamilus streckersoni]
MRVTVIILAVLAIHISCIYCKPALQPGGNPPPPGAKPVTPKVEEKPERPDKESGEIRPPHLQGENGQTPPPRPKEDKLQSLNPHHQGGNDQAPSPKP